MVLFVKCFYFVQDHIAYILQTSNMEQGKIKNIICEKKVILFLKCLSTVGPVRNVSRAIESPRELLVV